MFLRQGVALQNIALALAVVFISIGVLSGFVIASVVTALVLATTLGTVGLVSWLMNEAGACIAPGRISLVGENGLGLGFCSATACRTAVLKIVNLANSFSKGDGLIPEKNRLWWKAFGSLNVTITVELTCPSVPLLFVYMYRRFSCSPPLLLSVLAGVGVGRGVFRPFRGVHQRSLGVQSGEHFLFCATSLFASYTNVDRTRMPVLECSAQLTIAVAEYLRAF